MLKRLLRHLSGRGARSEGAAGRGTAQVDARGGAEEEALAAFRRALQRNPADAGAWTGAGACLRGLGRMEEAEASYASAIRLDPGLAEARLALGNFAYLRGDQDAAIEHLHAYVGQEPGNLAVQNLLGSLYAGQGRFEDARACQRAVIAVDPRFQQVYSIFLLLLNFDPDIGPAQVYAEHQRWGRLCAQPLTDAAAPCGNDPDPERRLRIGYVSPYFVRQPVGYFIEPVLEQRERAGCEIFLYSDAAKPDALTARLRRSSDFWRDTGALDDAQFAAQVRADRIDILVDLTGHNAHNRLLAFARRAAPLQVTYLGPGTTGMSAMDYRLSDHLVDPPGSEELSSERLLRLPGPQWAYRPPEETPEVSPLPALARGHITFGSFSNAAKLNAYTMALWAELLLRLPEARLRIAGVASDAHRRRLLAPFEARGVAPGRVSLLPAPDYDRYWELYHGVDIALDSYPFNGVTTTMGCLWMGLPVVSLSGPWLASRYGASLLGHLGAPRWAAANAAGFLDAAAELASDPQALAELRAGMRARLRASPLLDGAALARGIDAAYRDIWREWCRGRN
jgi:protein O-GlcNAc transferase